MEIIAKISKGSKMDQIYIPKNRNMLKIGEYVIIRPLSTEKEKTKDSKLHFYGLKNLEPLKLSIINEIIKTTNKYLKYDNLIVTGSFFEEGFNFNDLDLIIISENQPDINEIKKSLNLNLGINVDLIALNQKSLTRGLETDPLYQAMLSKCISTKRLSPIKKNKINYKLLDMHLLKSKPLFENFDILNGNEKYYSIRNLIAINLFLKKEKITIDKINKKIGLLFNVKSINEIKQNMINKKVFLDEYKKIYAETYSKILEGIKNESK